MQRVDKAALFQLFDDRDIDKLLRFRQRLFAWELILDHELNRFQRRARGFLQRRRVVLPGSLQDLLVIYLAVFAQDFFAELFVGPVTVHAARERA